MEFRRQEEGYNPPPPIRESAFTRPLPSLSSPPSLLSPRGGLTARNGVLPATPNPPPKDPDPVPAAAAPAGATTSGGGSIPKAATTTVAAAASEADAAVRYRECLRNHAASLGGHVLDGCGEFMPGGDAGTQEAMKCAACGCHRSFHRKEADRERSPFYRLPNGGHSRVPLLLPPPPPHHPQHHHHHHHHQKHFPTCFPPSPPAIVASGGTTTESSSEERNAGVTTAATAAAGGAAVFAPPSKKRHRTKFTAEQKERMLGFAQSVGWRIQKQDEGEMERFCAEIGISRQVLKVWMHNNKHSIRRPQHQLEQHHQDQHQHQQQP